jgi:casein kinase I family protein HRR25
MIVKMSKHIGTGSCVSSIGDFTSVLTKGKVFSRTIQEHSEDATRVAAVKKSRVSLRVKHPTLKHEGRVMQLFQGHPTIPATYASAYGQLPNFE